MHAAATAQKASGRKTPEGAGTAEKFRRYIDARRVELGLTYGDVHARLDRLKWPAGVQCPALATVGHWFNGRRRPRDMTHLSALCEVLETTLAEAMEGAGTAPVTGIEIAILEGVRKLDPTQAETVLALIVTMTKPKPRHHRGG